MAMSAEQLGLPNPELGQPIRFLCTAQKRLHAEGQRSFIGFTARSRAFLGRFLPKLGGIERCRLLFQVGRPGAITNACRSSCCIMGLAG